MVYVCAFVYAQYYICLAVRAMYMCCMPSSQFMSPLCYFKIRNKKYAQTHTCISLATVLTFPVRDTSPVIATFCLMGLFNARDMRADTIVIPALGPSFGTAPSGIWRWTGVV